ncbi:unnamed protein product [Ostreobium quekettii]|uniref:Ferric reductase NAD binding domain-containing protein n=1 Tax=Ostreobium quekettii TaxID=121088 RepID=A0A8S1JFD0_9CHLO|nr:unnamed protein product [Ostreobium quekettii]
MAQILYHKDTGIDIITGVAATTLTKFGRPNWQSVFNAMKAKHPKTTVGVLFCGAPLLGKVLRKLCIKFSQGSKTKFEFVSEKF